MPNIQVLDPHVADLIAAGEVVERPASVAKELMENAIDAGAHKITVEITHGGLTFLRVTDDGKGIPPEELKTAFLRHATSKLRTEYDLEAIGTLGFRGEALAAIAAVARVDVMSRTPDAPIGASLSLDGGVPGTVEESGCPLGTTMVVRDLFFNTPARLKFMKKDAAESAAVFALVQRVALSHPEVSIQFIRDGKQELLTPGDGQLTNAVYAVLGRELALGLRPVKAEEETMAVEGFVSLPACCRASRNWQYFFVNGRQVKSRLMAAALEEAYRNQKMVGKFPACVLYLTIKLGAVDVNVHPAKTEVKFHQERQVFSAVYHAVLSALEQDRSHPGLELSAAPKNPAVRTERPHPAEDPAPLNQIRISEPEPAAPAQKKASREPAASGTVRVSVHDTAFRPAPPLGSIPSMPRPNLDRASRPSAPKAAPAAEQVFIPVPDTPAPAAPEPAVPTPEPGPTPAPVPPIPAEVKMPEAPVLWRLAGEVLNTYIIVEQGDTVYLIDKHAAHERMNFDRMKAEDYTPMSQTLLVPAVCHLNPQEQTALLEQLPLLEQFGFSAEDLNGTLLVRQVPDYLDVGDIEGTLAELAQKLLAGHRVDPRGVRDELLHTMACKAAIKGGWKTSPQELERIAQAVLSGQVKYCPHGRPVAIQLTRKELEKQFKRA